MLRILRVELEGGWVVLVLQGHIAAEWGELLELECLDSLRSGLRVALDLSDVSFIGRSGLATLGRLGRLGVEFRRCSPLIADTLEQEGIAAGRAADDGNAPGAGGGATDE